MTRTQQMGLGVLLLGLLAVVAWNGLAQRPLWPKAAKPEVPAALTPLWSRAVPNFRNAAFSADDGYLAVASDRKGFVTFWQRSERTGKLFAVWHRPAAVAGADQLAVSRNGRYVLAYSRLNPMEPRLTLLNGRDGQSASETVDGAIWDLALASDGSAASFVTGNRALYQITLGDTPTVSRAFLANQGNSVAYALAAGGAAQVGGTWDAAGVTCLAAAGRILWQFPQNDSDRNRLQGKLFDVQTSQDGRFALGLAYRNASHNAVTAYFWRVDGDGRPLWTLDLGEDVSDPAACLNADGSRIALAYDRQLPRRDQNVKERRLRVLDRQGSPVWGGEKGGLVFAPHLICLAPDGQGLVISDGSQTLYRLNAQGRSAARLRLSASIRQTIPSADGRFLLVYTGDGLLTLLGVD